MRSKFIIHGVKRETYRVALILKAHADIDLMYGQLKALDASEIDARQKRAAVAGAKLKHVKEVYLKAMGLPLC